MERFRKTGPEECDVHHTARCLIADMSGYKQNEHDIAMRRLSAGIRWLVIQAESRRTVRPGIASVHAELTGQFMLGILDLRAPNGPTPGRHQG
jgi:hypothetical protein